MAIMNDKEAVMYAWGQSSGVRPFAPNVNRVGREAFGPEQAKPTLGETFGSAFGSMSDVVNSYYAVATSPYIYDYDDSFDPVTPERLKGYEDYELVLREAVNEQQQQAIKRNIDRERDNNDVLARSGFAGVVAGISASVLSPLTLLPFVGNLRTVRGAAKGVAGVTGAIAAQEAVLQAGQTLRPESEMYDNIIAGSLLGGIIGFGAYGLLKVKTPKAITELEKRVMQDLASDNLSLKDALLKNNFNLEDAAQDASKSLSAAKVADPILAQQIATKGRLVAREGEGIKGAAGVERALSELTPLYRTLNSTFLQTRNIAQQLINNPFFVNKNIQGKATTTSIETLKDLNRAQTILTQKAVDDVYVQYKKDAIKRGVPALPVSGNTVGSVLNKVLGKPQSETSFLDEVGRALRRGDKHENPFIQKAAEIYRKEIFDRFGNEAVRAGIWKKLPDVKTAESYYSKLRDKDKILENQEEYKQILRNYLGDELTSEVTRINAKHDRIAANIQSELDSLDINSFRKASMLQREAEIAGAELGLTTGDIAASLEILAGGRPKKPKTLLKFIAEKGGILDEDFKTYYSKSFSDVLPWNKSNRATLVNAYDKGGVALDDLALAAWERGYFPDKASRPDIQELVDAIDDELRGLKEYVKLSDKDALDDFYYFRDIEETVASLGIDAKKYKGGRILLADNELVDIRTAFTKLADKNAKKKKTALVKKLGEVEARRREAILDAGEDSFDDYLDEAVESVFHNIVHASDVHPNVDIPIIERGPLKARKLLIRDEVEEAFLVNDASLIASRYARVVGTEAELMQRFGTLDVKDILKPLDAEYKERLGQLGKNTGERTKLRNEWKKNREDLIAMHELLRGTYEGSLYNIDNMAGIIGRTTLKYNYIRMLGGVFLSSIPDLGKLVAHQGFIPFLRDGVAPFSKALPGIIKGISEASIQELKLADLALQHITNSRLLSLGDLGASYGKINNFERFVDGSVDVFSKATGLPYWNNMIELMGGFMSQQRIAKNILAKTLPDKEREYMAALGLGDAEIKRLRPYFEKYGKESKKTGVFVAGTDKWENIADVKLYRAALNKDVRSMALQKSIGDVPLMANKWYGQLLLQFKSFLFAATNKTLITSLQRRDMAVLQGMSMMIGLGMLSYVVKAKLAGYEVDTSPEKLIIEGIDRSGVLGILMEASNTLDSAGLGVQSALGTGLPSRYASRTAVESLAGPTFGTAANMFMAGRALSPFTDDKLTDADRKNIRKLIPFNNLFYIQALMAKADKDTRARLGY